MLRDLAKRAVARAGRTAVGEHAVHAAVMPDPAERTLATVEHWPESLDGFEQLAFLFTSGRLNHGIASLAFDEAAHLFRTARAIGPGTLVEIGRFKGGGTLLLAAAMHPASELYSYDLQARPLLGVSGAELDLALEQALRRFGFEARVHLVVGDSRTSPPPPAPCSLIFIDGDHSYEGARSDLERWMELVAPGGHVLFHDAVDPGGYASYEPGVARLVEELAGDPSSGLARREGAGSIAHFVRSP